MRGYVEALEARAQGLGLNEVERAMLAPTTAQLRANEDAVAEAELDLIAMPDRDADQ